MSKRFWNFIVNAATETEPESVELRISGDIIDDEWAWLYEWFGIQAASPNAFRTELANHAGKNITVWIDSYGGSVFAGMGLFNALMEHKNTGGKVTTIADTKTMSAATLPYMAGDERLITPGGMFMMHNPLTDASGYASDLRKVADVLDEVKESIMNIYQLGTGLSRKRISELMDGETYMSAQTAIKEGFATGMKYAEANENSGGIVNFMFNRLAIQNIANDSMREFIKIAQDRLGESQKPSDQQVSPPVENKNKGSEKMPFANIDELRADSPELVNQIETAARNDGAAQERERIKGIEAISKNIAPDLVNKAKFETPMDAKDLAFQALQANASLGKTYIDNAIADNKTSGVESVSATPVDVQDTGKKPAGINDRFKNVAAKLDAKRRGITVE